MTKNVVGLFDNRMTAEAATQNLVDAGFARSDIRVVAAESEGQLFREQVEASGSFVGEGASVGITSGAIVGGLLGLLVGAGFVLVPAGVPAAGPITGLIVGSAAGAVTGGIVGALIGLGVPASAPDIYTEGIQRAGTLLVVEADEDKLDEVRSIMDRDGVTDIQVRDVLISRRTPATVYPAGQEERPLATPGRGFAYADQPAEVNRETGANQTVGHAYADNPPGNVPPAGDTTDVENTMGGVRPRYGSLDDEENRTPNR